MTNLAYRRRARGVETPKGAAVFMLGVAALLWVLEVVDTLTFHALDQLGIHSQTADGWVGIFFAPFLHFGFEHLISNTGPLLVLGFLILVGIGGLLRFVVSTVTSAVTSGLTAWLLTPMHALVEGASGVIFGWLTYSIARGIFARDWKSLLIAVVVFMLYGSVIWGVFPTQAGVSWQGHLGGAVGGVLAAWMLHRRQVRRV